jgi:hypothetical protein
VRLQALDIFYPIGFKVSGSKSLLQPGKVIRHLGLNVYSDYGSVWAPEHKVVRLKCLTEELLRRSSQAVPWREVATVNGILGSLRMAVPAKLILARGLMRSLQQLPVLHDREVQGKQWEHYKEGGAPQPLS